MRARQPILSKLNDQLFDHSSDIDEQIGLSRILPHSPKQLNSSYLNGANDPRSEWFFDSDSSFNVSIVNDDIPQASRHSWDNYFQRIYTLCLNFLPILVIIGPTSLLIILKTFQINISFGDEKLKPSSDLKIDLNYYPKMLIDLCSILLLSWLLKFFLDFPWNWYTQISKVKQKLILLIDKLKDDRKTTKNDDYKFNNLLQNMKSLKFQNFFALSLCFISPFLCGILLYISRSYITILEDSNGILSDLTIVIFISCGLIRLLIQLSDFVQNLTHSIDVINSKLIQEIYLDQEEKVNQLQETSIGSINDVETINLSKKLSKLEDNFTQLALKFELFYSKNKFIIESNDQSFISSKHFKILEKEFNSLNVRLNEKINEFEMNFQNISINSTNTRHLNHESSLSLHELSEIEPDYINTQKKLEYQQRETSLHGIPLIPNGDKIFRASPLIGSNFKITPSLNESTHIDSQDSKQQAINNSSSTYQNKRNQLLNQTLSNNEIRNGVLENEYGEQAFQGITLWNLRIKPTVKYFINIPLLFNKMIWKFLSFLPIQILKFIHLILLIVLDFLLTFKEKKVQY